MVVYIEIVLLENLLIDGLLLWLVLQCIRVKTNWWGLVLASVFGSGFALASPSIQLDGVLAIGLKIGVAIIMCIMLCLNFRKLWLKTLLFVLFTFGFGGVLIALFSFMGVSTTTGLVFGYNTDIPLGAILAGIIIFAIIIFRLIKKFYKHKKIVQFYYEIELTINHQQSILRGFLDTGNTLDNAQGKPIVVVGSKQLNQWFDANEQLALLMGKYGLIGLSNFQTLEVQSVAGKEKIFVFDVEKCMFECKPKEVAVGVCLNEKFFRKGFDVILNPRLLE